MPKALPRPERYTTLPAGPRYGPPSPTRAMSPAEHPASWYMARLSDGHGRHHMTRTLVGRSVPWPHGVRRYDGMGGGCDGCIRAHSAADWRVRGSCFEGCNCEAICPCRSVGGRPGGPSSFGECFGALSWHIHDGYADGIDLSGLRAVMLLRYFDRVQPSTPPARITLEHVKPRKRIKVVGYLTVEAEGSASEPGDVRCGIPGFDHSGTELHGSELRSTDPALHWEVRGRRHAAFATDFDYRSDR
jgi:Protein of unknown function (DUF1326)